MYLSANEKSAFFECAIAALISFCSSVEFSLAGVLSAAVLDEATLCELSASSVGQTQDSKL